MEKEVINGTDSAQVDETELSPAERVSLKVADNIYNRAFGSRRDVREQGSLRLRYVNDFPQLNYQYVSFRSDQKMILRGGLYWLKRVNFKITDPLSCAVSGDPWRNDPELFGVESSAHAEAAPNGDAGVEPRGLVVFCHGIAGGHSDYLSLIYWFASQGYVVFGYDNTGYYSSEGEGLIGLEQAPRDLYAALRFAAEQKELSHFTPILAGHSWGGYAVCAILGMPGIPRIGGVISISGFDRAGDIIVEQGVQRFGRMWHLFTPAFYMRRRLLFQSDTGIRASSCVLASDVPVLIFHGMMDNVVSLRRSIAYRTFRRDYRQQRRRSDTLEELYPPEKKGSSVPEPGGGNQSIPVATLSVPASTRSPHSTGSLGYELLPDLQKQIFKQLRREAKRIEDLSEFDLQQIYNAAVTESEDLRITSRSTQELYRTRRDESKPRRRNRPDIMYLLRRAYTRGGLLALPLSTSRVTVYVMPDTGHTPFLSDNALIYRYRQYQRQKEMVEEYGDVAQIPEEEWSRFIGNFDAEYADSPNLILMQAMENFLAKLEVPASEVPASDVEG
ncbi:MAG: alpha/beta hydrolase [Clostridiaceae bacterium]|nr:alpha/beta hydrolase [Clostridiaceae bacterium]